MTDPLPKTVAVSCSVPLGNTCMAVAPTELDRRREALLPAFVKQIPRPFGQCFQPHFAFRRQRPTTKCGPLIADPLTEAEALSCDVVSRHTGVAVDSTELACCDNPTLPPLIELVPRPPGEGFQSRDTIRRQPPAMKRSFLIADPCPETEASYCDVSAGDARVPMAATKIASGGEALLPPPIAHPPRPLRKGFQPLCAILR